MTLRKQARTASRLVQTPASREIASVSVRVPAKNKGPGLGGIETGPELRSSRMRRQKVGQQGAKTRHRGTATAIQSIRLTA
jgi:hypothetical protein